MAQWLRPPVGCFREPRFNSQQHMAAYNYLKVQFQEIQCPPLASVPNIYMVHRYICPYTQTNNIFRGGTGGTGRGGCRREGGGWEEEKGKNLGTEQQKWRGWSWSHAPLIPAIWEVEAGRLGIQGYAQLYIEFEANLIYWKVCLKKPKVAVEMTQQVRMLAIQV